LGDKKEGIEMSQDTWSYERTTLSDVYARPNAEEDKKKGRKGIKSIHSAQVTVYPSTEVSCIPSGIK
jgi:hypothetical protein